MNHRFTDPLAPIYVLHGDETLLSLEAADAIRSTARAQGYTEREVYTADANFDWSQLRDATASFSLFAEKKIIDLRIPNGKPGNEGAEALIELTHAIDPQSMLVLLSLPKLERAQLQSKWFTTLSKIAKIIEARPISRHELPQWIQQRLQQQNQQLTPDALSFFVDRVEGNLLAAKQEIHKLALLYPSGQLTLESVQKAIANVARFDVFKLSESWLAGDPTRAMRLIDGLIAEGTATTLVLWSIAEDIRLLLRLRQGLSEGKNLSMLSQSLRIWGKKQSLVQPAFKRLGARTLMHALNECAHIDRQIKGVNHGEPWLAIRRLVKQLAQKQAHTS